MLAVAQAAEASPRWPRPEKYTVAVRWHPSTHTLSGTERIALVNDGPSALSSVWLRLWPNGYGSCKRHYARVDVIGGGAAAGAAVACTALKVRLARPVAPGRSATVRLRLRVTVPSKPNRFGRDSGVVYLGNALPLLAVEDAGGPALEPYTDLGDPFYSRSAAWSVRLDLPAGLTAATTGSVNHHLRVGHGLERLRIFARHARDFAIVIGHLDSSSVRTSTGLKITRYRPVDQDREASLATLDTARLAVEQYTAWYGPPGVSEIDIAPPPASLGQFGAGMEFPGLVLAPDTGGYTAHELAHQWWYSLVGDDQWRSPWLDESFAEFSARRLPASVVGPDDLECDPGDPVGSKGRGPLSASMHQWDQVGGEPYYNVVYLGGACALRSLESDLGADWMTSFLRGFADGHRWQLVTPSSFVDALRAAAPAGYDVDGWLKRAEIELP